MTDFLTISAQLKYFKKTNKSLITQSSFRAVFFFYLLLLLLLSSNVYAAQGSPAATVIAIRGEVQATDPEGNLRKLQIKSELFQNDTISTDKRGRIQFMFTDNTIISLGRKSTLQISEYFLDHNNSGKLDTIVSEGVFRVMGGILTKTSPDNFNLQTPSGNIGIRGSMYTGKVANGETTVIFEGGKGITFKNKTGLVVISKPGNGTNVRGINSTIPQPRKFTRNELRGFQTELSIQTNTGAGKDSQQAGSSFVIPATFSVSDAQQLNSAIEVKLTEGLQAGEKEANQKEQSEEEQIQELEELTQQVKENPEDAANILKNAIIDNSVPVETAMEAILKGMSKPNKEDFSQLMEQALEMGITLENARELVKSLKENGGICK
jgi:hypothetical protein